MMAPKAGTKSDSLFPYSGGSESPSLRQIKSVPGVVLKGSSGLTGTGTGYVRSSDDGAELQFKAPGSSRWGSPVPIPVNDTYILLDGDDDDKYLRVEVKRTMLAIQQQPTTESLATGFVDQIDSEELAGVEIDPALRDYYRKIEVDNMWEGYTDPGGRGQVAWTSLVGLASGAITAGANLSWDSNTLNLDPSISIVDVTLSGKVKPHMDDTGEPTGFTYSEDTESLISFVNGTRTFTITPVATSFGFFHTGIKFTKSAAESVIISDTEGLHYIYYNSSGVLTSTTSFPGWAHAWVAMIQWDATNKLGIPLNERHRFGNPNLHYRDHFAFGALHTGGFAIDGYTLDTATDAAVTFGLDSGTFSDEDIEHSLDADADPATVPVFYLNGAGADVRWDTGTDYAFKNTAAGRVNWNELTGGAWQQTECTDNYFVAYYICAWTNDGDYKYISIQGQREDQKLADSIIGNEFADLELGDFGPELRPLYMLIIQSKNTFGNTRKAKIQYVEDIRSINVPAGAAASQGSHSRLHALDDTADHSLGGLTASRIVSTDADSLASVTNLTTWVKGTSNQVISTDQGDGTLVLSTPQDIDTGASVDFVQVTTTTLLVDDILQRTGGHGVVFGSDAKFEAAMYYGTFADGNDNLMEISTASGYASGIQCEELNGYGAIFKYSGSDNLLGIYKLNVDAETPGILIDRSTGVGTQAYVYGFLNVYNGVGTQISQYATSAGHPYWRLYNDAGDTVINEINSNGVSYFNGGNVEIRGGNIFKFDHAAELTGAHGCVFDNEIYMLANTNATSIFGRAIINSPFSDYAAFSHYDRATASGFALLQGPAGNTILNAETGGNIFLRIGGAATRLKVFTDRVEITTTNAFANTTLHGDHIELQKITYAGGGWARTLMSFLEHDDTVYMELGAFGTNNTFAYGYIGEAYNDSAIKWNHSNQVGINRSSTALSYNLDVNGDAGFVGTVYGNHFDELDGGHNMVFGSLIEATAGLSVTGNILMDEDTYIGIGAAAERIVFDGDGNTVFVRGAAFDVCDGVIIASDKVVLTQADQNEYIDSLADGYLDAEATTGIRLRINTVEQVILTDGKLAPTTDDDIDLGDSTHAFKDLYIDGIIYNDRFAELTPAHKIIFDDDMNPLEDIYMENGKNIYWADSGDTDRSMLEVNGDVFLIGNVNIQTQIVGNPDIIMGVPIKIKETAAAVADTASYGQIWVKDDAPNILMFTDDTGVDYTVDVTAV